MSEGLLSTFSSQRGILAWVPALLLAAMTAFLVCTPADRQMTGNLGDSRDATIKPADVPTASSRSLAEVAVQKPAVLDENTVRDLLPVRPVAWADPAIDDELSTPPPVVKADPAPEELPIGDPALSEQVQISIDRDRLTLTARDAPLGAVLSLIAQQHGLNIICGEELSQKITVNLRAVPLTDAPDALLAINGFTWITQRNLLVVTSLAGVQKASPMIQGRVVHVFPLNYVGAADVDKAIKGLLSPVGQSFVSQTTPGDPRRTHEQVMVEDLPFYLDRIARYIQSIDCQPRQVLVEAHVLQVTLKDDCKHGVNFDQLLRVAGADVNLVTQGFANPSAMPASLIRIDGSDLGAVIEALKTTTDAKTLASPKVAVLNGQEARIQVGGQIGYLTTTTTETNAVQTVNFLSTGVILRVIPAITADRQVLLDVKPQVSTGRINPLTTLPESETTEVETKIMLADGEAVIIGGLIKELDSDVQSKIPWLGDIRYVGWMFRRRNMVRERSEVIIALLPRIIGDEPGCRQPNSAEVERSRTPLFSGPLNHIDRTDWEPLLPSASYLPRVPRLPSVEYGVLPGNSGNQELPHYPLPLQPFPAIQSPFAPPPVPPVSTDAPLSSRRSLPSQTPATSPAADAAISHRDAPVHRLPALEE